MHLQLSRLTFSICLLIALLLVSCLNQPEVQEDGVSTGFILGMDIDEFKAMFPDAREEEPGQYHRNSIEFGVRGEWIYSFHDNSLSWYLFNANVTNITRNNFDKTFQATNSLISEYIGEFGEPWRDERGYTEYIDPNTQDHSGYKVREAQWKTENGQLVVDFTFLGEGGVYSLLLTVQATS